MKATVACRLRTIFYALLVVGACLVSLPAIAQNYIPAINAFADATNSGSACNATDLGDDQDTDRGNPEWKAIDLDPNHPLPNNPTRIVEGYVSPVPTDENQDSQAPAEVSEEEIPWNHYTHDYTFKVLPDPNYQYLLGSWARFPGMTFGTQSEVACHGWGGSFSNNICSFPADTCSNGPTCNHQVMEVEWENGSAMKVNDDDDRKWGSLPEYAWPSVGDRVWVEGRWIFDCGHPGVSNLNDAEAIIPTILGTHLKDYVKYSTEFHPPRALVTFRLDHTSAGLDVANHSGDVYRAASDDPSSWLPVTGAALPRPFFALPPWTPPTLIPVTEADIFVSGNGGGANDKCNLKQNCDGDNDHTGPVIPINDLNYVFDIYPPGTVYGALFGFGSLVNGTIPIARPTPDSSLQWRIVDHTDEIPDHTCGPDKSYCVMVQPIICPVDENTPPPPSDPIQQTQMGTTCPAMPANPSRLRVILPFAGSNANYYAQSILLGWDDVPDPAGHHTPAVRRFNITLNRFDVDQNGRCSLCGDGDWRLFLDMGGQWRWMSWLYNTDHGIYAFNGGDNLGSGDPLTENGDNDYYFFSRSPWTINVTDGTPIHVAVGGFDSGPSDGGYCRSYSGSGCDSGILGFIGLGFADVIALARIGTYEFDLVPSNNYAPPPPLQIPETSTERQYTVSFNLNEIPPPAPPLSTFQIGNPHFGNYVSSASPIILSSPTFGAQGFQYRFYRQGGPLPTYASGGLPFPLHWANVGFSNGQSASVFVNGANASGDGVYNLQYSAETVWNLLEPRHTQTITLDNTPPVTTIGQPVAVQYPHSAIVTLNYSADDGIGSGVKTLVATIDGHVTFLDGTPVSNGQAVHFLTALSLGPHTFTVIASDNLNNSGTTSVAFSVVVTAQSIKDDVTQFVASGKITLNETALLAKLDAAAKSRAAGNCTAANNQYDAFINQVMAQSGKKIDPAAAQIMIADAQYLMAHCP